MTRKIEKLEDIELNLKNPNAGSPRGEQQMEASLRRYGYGRSVLADKNGKIIGGNHVVSTGGSLGMTKIRPVHTTGDELVVVIRDDLDLDKDPRAKELVYVDNRVSQVNYTLDGEVLLEDLLEGLNLKDFYRQEELDFLTAAHRSQEVDSILTAMDDDAAHADDDDLWETIKLDVRQSTRFRFNKFMKIMEGKNDDERLQLLLGYAEEALYADDDDDDSYFDDELDEDA